MDISQFVYPFSSRYLKSSSFLSVFAFLVCVFCLAISYKAVVLLFQLDTCMCQIIELHGKFMCNFIRYSFFQSEYTVMHSQWVNEWGFQLLNIFCQQLILSAFLKIVFVTYNIYIKIYPFKISFIFDKWIFME